MRTIGDEEHVNFLLIIPSLFPKGLKSLPEADWRKFSLRRTNKILFFFRWCRTTTWKEKYFHFDKLTMTLFFFLI